MPKFVFLWTDIFVWLVFAMTVFYGMRVAANANSRRSWRRVFAAPTPMCASIVVLVFVFIGLTDSIHFRSRLDVAPGAQAREAAYSGETLSVLDVMLTRIRESREKTYSMPLATRSFAKESIAADGGPARDYARLKFGGAHLTDPDRTWSGDVAGRAGCGERG